MSWFTTTTSQKSLSWLELLVRELLMSDGISNVSESQAIMKGRTNYRWLKVTSGGISKQQYLNATEAIFCTLLLLPQCTYYPVCLGSLLSRHCNLQPNI